MKFVLRTLLTVTLTVGVFSTLAVHPALAGLSDERQILLLRAQQLILSGETLSPDLVPDLHSIDPDLQSARYELALVEDNADSRGSITMQIDDPTVGKTTNIRIVYIPKSDFGPDAALMVGHPWQYPSNLQFTSQDSTEYLQVSSGENQFVFSHERWSGSHGGMDTIAELPVVKLVASTIRANQAIVLELNNYQLPNEVLQTFTIPIYVKLNAAAPFVLVPPHLVELSAGPLSQLALDADSLLQPGEEVNLKVHLLDSFGNLTRDRVLSLDLLVNGSFKQRIDVTSAIQVVRNVRFNVPGVYQLEVRSGGGGLRGMSNPVLVEENHREKIVWLNLGITTNLSDGTLPAEPLAYTGLFDVELAADHSEYLTSESRSEIDGVHAVHSFKAGSRQQYLTLQNAGQQKVLVTLAEAPTDIRYLSPDELKLAQIAGHDSAYLWHGEQVVGSGYPVGFVAVNHTHQSKPEASKLFTAVRVNPGQTWFDALENAQTYVSVGSKIILQYDMNRLAVDKRRSLSIRVIADQPVVSIALIKNGEQIARLAKVNPQPGHLDFQLHSSSQPRSTHHSKPRNAREWIGYLGTRDNSLSVQLLEQGWLARLSNDKQRVDFMTRTHGLAKRLAVTVANPSQDTVLEVGFASGYEDAAWLPIDRLPQAIPAQRYLIPYSEVEQGATRIMSIDGYEDKMTISRSLLPLESDLEFDHEDLSRARIGDYYYFIVVLSDGSYAVSSPQLVGDY